MCGIFGSFNFRRFEKLYEANRKRGDFAVGTMYITKNAAPGMAKNTWLRKRQGIVDLTSHYSFKNDYDQYLGHTQAPTSINRDFSPETTHPFDSIHYQVAHNGVLSNHKQLGEDLLSAWWKDECVDSEIIPGLLSVNVEFDEEIIMSYQNDTGKTEDVLTIEKTCNMLEGTFGLWVYSKLSGDTFIVRNGCTLFGNIQSGDFSSVPVAGICDEPLKEGVVYCVTSEGLTECGEFESSSPFFL
jgi:glucosamine 6-phosphate synthetase-like amidotransferase/phosphosugar isomerase protein